ncbi:helix-turn-helix domain-containing protein, partial [Carnobacterium maltaromaticum]|uniref:helix-turn-helix domain-containing protein n=1 Tax=Carnobacterium maltaromaticum TaxID=2751 RepID=UPI00055187D0
MKVSTSTRLKQIMSERNLKQVDILRMSLPLQKELGIKMGKSTLSQYVNGIQSPDQHRIYLLSKTLDVNEPWLMGFDVDKKRIPDNERGPIEEKIGLSKDITHIYDKLDFHRQEIVYATAKKQLEEQQKKLK